MLEDAGLLDALVILETDISAADRILQAEGLSDYRLNLDNQTICRTLEDQLLYLQSIVKGLQEVLDAPDIQNLIQQLADLHTRAEDLENELRNTTGKIAAFEERSRLLLETLTEKEANLPIIQVQMQQQQRLFQDILFCLFGA